jgi:hypothetical protein
MSLVPSSKITAFHGECHTVPSMKRLTLARCASALLALLVLICAAKANALHLTDLQGHSVEQLATAGERVVVLIFAATDCPISNRYIPEIERLRREQSERGVAFWWVFPNPGDTLPIVRRHSKDFSISTPTLIDPQQELVHMAHASVTPEAAVFAVNHGALREVYRGRIDDRYIAFGQERPQATHHELEQAIEAALTGKPAPEPAGSPVGCSIVPITSTPSTSKL